MSARGGSVSKMKTSLYLALLAIISGVLLFTKCNHADSIGGQMKLLRMMDFRRTLDKPINYYGKVVDLQGNPIANVSVEVHISQTSGKKTNNYSTGTDGRFNVTGIDGRKCKADSQLLRSVIH